MTSRVHKTVLRTARGNLIPGVEDEASGTWCADEGLGLEFQIDVLLKNGWERA